MRKVHNHSNESNSLQCGSTVSRTINAPLPQVWSLVRQFSKPQVYKPFVRSCTMQVGLGGVGSVREIKLVSGLADRTAVERLDEFDDGSHLMVVRTIGGDNRLRNYQSTTVLRELENHKTMVSESYVVDVPHDSNEEDTCRVVEAIIGFNLQSLDLVTAKTSAVKI